MRSLTDIDITQTKSYIFSKKDIFPLKNRPFENIQLPAPLNKRAFLKSLFGKIGNPYKICIVYNFDLHKWQMQSCLALCLHMKYPYVHRCPATKTTELELLLTPDK